MATWDDVDAACMALPSVTRELRREGNRVWGVQGRSFAWERPLRGSDRRALGSAAPEGEILAVRVVDLDDRAVLISEDPAVFFTIPHFAGFPAVLALLERIDPDDLVGLLTDGWLLRAQGEALEVFWADQRGEHQRVDRHANGNVRARGTMLDGVLHGDWQWFRTDGTLMRSGSFERGERVGQWTTFDRGERAVRTTQTPRQS